MLPQTTPPIDDSCCDCNYLFVAKGSFSTTTTTTMSIPATLLDQFELAHVGVIGGNTNPRRFQTAFSESFVLEQLIDMTLEACALQCSSYLDCEGFIAYTLEDNRLRCNLLSRAEGVTTTSLQALSYKRVVFPTTKTSTTTSTTTTTTTSTPTTTTTTTTS
eukprot:gene8272-10170_t